jgi:NAD(P)-dependent dehydrogenase (short-subunit alcohol dehydrogenase family)
LHSAIQSRPEILTGDIGELVISANESEMNSTLQPTPEVTEDEWERVFHVNVKSIFWAAKYFMPRMIGQGQGGSMINISSVGASRPRPGLVWYNASKGAVSNVSGTQRDYHLLKVTESPNLLVFSHLPCQATKGLAAEFGPHNIRVNSICPLLCATGLFSTFTGTPDTPENRAKFIFNVPLGRLAEVEDVANMCLYLASDEGKFINGTDLVIDGGRCI